MVFANSCNEKISEEIEPIVAIDEEITIEEAREFYESTTANLRQKKQKRKKSIYWEKGKTKSFKDKYALAVIPIKYEDDDKMTIDGRDSKINLIEPYSYLVIKKKGKIKEEYTFKALFDPSFLNLYTFIFNDEIINEMSVWGMGTQNSESPNLKTKGNKDICYSVSYPCPEYSLRAREINGCTATVCLRSTSGGSPSAWFSPFDNYDTGGGYNQAGVYISGTTSGGETLSHEDAMALIDSERFNLPYIYFKNGNVPAFQYPPGSDYASKFPKLTEYLKNQMPKIQDNVVVVNAIKKYTNLTDDQIKKHLAWNSGPVILIEQLGNPNGEERFGLFRTNEPNILRIDLDLVNDLENSKIGTGLADSFAFLVGVTILHEYVHYGDNLDGKDYPGEEGNLFELDAYGQTVIRSNSLEIILKRK